MKSLLAKNLTLLSVLLLVQALVAAPSGGPYGPRHLEYALPNDTSHVVYVSPNGDGSAIGDSIDAPTTIENAIQNAESGTTIVMREGTYRTGNLVFNQGITLQPYLREKVVMKGTLVASDWESLRDGYWRIHWEKLFPSTPQDWWRRQREGMFTPPWNFNNDMVFKNGELLKAKGWEGELDDNSYTIDYQNGYVYIHFDPTDQLIEITAWDVCLLRTIEDLNGRQNDHLGPVIRGITLTQYAYRAIEIEAIEPVGPQSPGSYGQDVLGTTLEDVSISYCSRVAGYFRGDDMVFRHCLISNTGTEGIYIVGSADVLLEGNIVTHTNIEPITGYYASAVKIFNQSDRVVVRNNLIIDNPQSCGVWWDVGNDNGVFINNWVENTNQGFFFEISQMAVCAGNVFVNCNEGVRVLNSRDVEVYQNTFVNSQLLIERNSRSAANDHFGWHPATGPDVDERQGHVVTHNFMVSTPEFKDPLMRVIQPPELCGQLLETPLKEMGANVFVHESSSQIQPFITMSPVEGPEDCTRNYETFEAFQKDFPQFSDETEVWNDYKGQVLQNIRIHKLDLLQDFPGNQKVTSLPEKIRIMLDLPLDTPIRRGAYPEGHM